MPIIHRAVQVPQCRAGLHLGPRSAETVYASRALALDPDFPEFSYKLAFSFFRFHKTLDSQRCASEAVRWRPEFPKANAASGGPWPRIIRRQTKCPSP